MRYHGKFEGTAAKKLYLVNPSQPTKKDVKHQRIINQRKKLMKAVIKALFKRALMGIGLLLAYASVFTTFLSLLLIIVEPNVWTYLFWGSSVGYAFLVLNCRGFECIGDRMGIKW